MIISKIEIANFQSHKKTSITLAPFTALIGLSSSGKTSVLRLLEWVFYGEWDNTYPADPDKPTIGVVTLADGTRISRVRQGDKNRAIIIPPGMEAKDASVLKDFGAVIPGVFDLVNLRPITINKKTINLNFAKAKEPLFLIANDPYSRPMKAQWLGRLYGAHVVNSILRLMAADKNSASSSVKESETEAKTLQERLSAFGGLDAQESTLEALEGIFERYKRLLVVREQRDSAVSKQDELAKLKRLEHVNIELYRVLLNKLSRLNEISDRMSSLHADQELVDKNKTLLGFDSNLARVSLDRLNRLHWLAQRQSEYRRSAEPIKKRGALASANLVTLGKKIEKLQHLKSYSLSLHAVSNNDELSLKLAKVNEAIKSERGQLCGALFSNGFCPICGNDNVQIAADEMGRNLENVVAAGGSWG